MNKTRRELVLFASAAALTYLSPSQLFASTDEVCAPGHESKECWMNAVFNTLHATNSPLHLGRFLDPMYYLLDKIAWNPDPGIEAAPVTVPAHFVTDLTSVPRLFWSELRPDGEYAFAAIVHDYLYWEQPAGIARSDADLVLKYIMEEFGVPRIKVGAIYAAVRSFGGGPWGANARLKAEGEKRILKRVPKSPKVRWSDWKQEEGVFG